MRLIEEKKLMIQGIISALLVITIVLIQIAEMKISYYDNKLVKEQNNINNHFIGLNHALIGSYFNKLLGYTSSKDTIEIDTNISFSLSPTHNYKTDTINNNRSDLWASVVNGELDLNDYYFKVSELLGAEYTEIYYDYHQLGIDYKEMSKSEPIWVKLKKWFIVSEFILILLNLYLYASLFVSIKGRIDN